MQALKVLAVLFSLGNDVQGAACGVDNRSAGDADFRHQVAATHISAGNGGDALGGIDEAGVPQRRSIAAGVVVRVECINAVVFRGHVEDVMSAE